MHKEKKTIVCIGFANSHGLIRVMVSDSLQDILGTIPTPQWEPLYYKWMRVSLAYAKYVPGNHGERKGSKCTIGLSVSTAITMDPPALSSKS